MVVLTVSLALSALMIGSRTRQRKKGELGDAVAADSAESPSNADSAEQPKEWAVKVRQFSMQTMQVAGEKKQQVARKEWAARVGGSRLSR